MDKIIQTANGCQKQELWQYHITWYIKNHTNRLSECEEAPIAQKLKQLCKELKVKLEKVTIENHRVCLMVQADTQLNISKIVRNLQKKFVKSVGQMNPQLGEAVWETNSLIVTKTNQPSRKDIRVQKILKNFSEVGYYDLYEGFTSQLGQFRKYLGELNLGVVEWGERLYLIDHKALSHEINLNCFECTKIYQYGCCCGKPCDFGVRSKKVFDEHFEAIREEVKALDETRYQEIMNQGGFVTSDGAISECEGRCSLLVHHEGVYKCIAHKYGLEHQIPIYAICPLSCLMYPLEILELITEKQKKVILLTSVLEEAFAKEFGRWGSYESLDVDLRCLSKKSHDHLFKEEDYTPLYEVNKGLISHEFGKGVYEGIQQVMHP
ncbi:MAG: transposase [Cellulosilyticaceae bacterium]